MEQLKMEGMPEEVRTGKKDRISSEDREAYNIISSPLKKVISAEGIPGEIIQNSNDGKKSSYTNIFFYTESYSICRIHNDNKGKHIRIHKRYKKEALKYADFKERKNDNYIYTSLKSINDLEMLAPLFRFILEDILVSLPTDFGCCSRYEQCSNAKKCVNPILDISLQCAYRKNLRKGLIFYGENKIDVKDYQI